MSAELIMNLPSIIQGGMGVAISNWKLARAVSSQGQLGVVSGTGISLVMIARLMEGDKEGHVRRALSQFPFQEPVQRVLNNFFVAKPSTPRAPYKRPPMWTLKPAKVLEELTVLSNFVEIFLAKEGHKNPVGLNLLEKIQMPTMASLYGAMLAKVDVVIMGAGIPVQIPGILDRLAKHEKVTYRLDVEGAAKDDDYSLAFDPEALFPKIKEKLGDLFRPSFLPVISSTVLAKALIGRASGKVDGFIIEEPTAGGHNAPPRGPLNLDEAGEPIYGKKDLVDLAKIKQIGLPFWLAGGYDSPEKLRFAQEAGAAGIQVGTAFGYCAESGMDEALKDQIIQKVQNKLLQVRTDPLVSPTGYPFKVVNVEGTLSDSAVYEDRTRLCDLGLLRHIYKQEDGGVGYRCPAEPTEQYLRKEGELEETTAKVCLCNNLCATAGFAQRRKDGYVEPPIVTAGDELLNIGKYLKQGQSSYSAKDVLDYLTL